MSADGVRAGPPDRDGALAVTWLGHSTVLLELDGVRLLTDPLLGSRIGPLVRLHPPIAPELVDDVDAVLLSHLHGDHADARSLRALGAERLVIAPPGARRWLERRGARNVLELAVGGWTRVGSVAVAATPARHGGGGLHGRPRAAPCGYLIVGSQTCYFAGDTDLFAGMARLHGLVDLALLPVGGWGRTLGPGHLDPSRAARAARLIAPRVAVPIHWGTLALSWPRALQPDLVLPGREFAAAVAQGPEQIAVRVLRVGERLALDAPTVEPDAGAPA